MIFWIILLILSALAVLAVNDLTAASTWIGSIAVVGGVVFLSRRNQFIHKASDLVQKGQSLEPYSYSKQTRKLILIFFFVAAAFFLPLLLSELLAFSLWIGCLIGIIDGWILQLVGFNLYLSRWQDEQNGKLYSVQIWKGSKVEYTGLSFVRRRDVK